MGLTGWRRKCSHQLDALPRAIRACCHRLAAASATTRSRCLGVRIYLTVDTFD